MCHKHTIFIEFQVHFSFWQGEVVCILWFIHNSNRYWTLLHLYKFDIPTLHIGKGTFCQRCMENKMMQCRVVYLLFWMKCSCLVLMPVMILIHFGFFICDVFSPLFSAIFRLARGKWWTLGESLAGPKSLATFSLTLCRILV